MTEQRMRARAIARAATKPPRSVRRAKARMGRPHGRKAAKAAVRVAAYDLAGARDALRLIVQTTHAAQARAGVMPHTPRAKSRERLKPHLGTTR
jgi:hypothetical protein